MEMTFTQAKSTDLEAVVSLLANDPLGAKREQFSMPLPAAYLMAFDNIQKDPNQELMVVKLKDEIIGTFQLSFIQYLTYRGGVRAQLEAVRVREDQRGEGVGRQILDYCIRRSKERKAHVLQLTTDKKRPAALKFYESFGFVSSHEGMKLHLS